MMNRKVVITGMGAITPVGNDVNTFWNNIKAGVNGIDFIKSFDTEKFRVKIGAEVKNFDPASHMEKKEARRTDKFCQYAIAAAKEAVEDSGLDVTKIDSERFGVLLGTGVGGLQTIEKEVRTLNEKGPGRVSPLLIPMIISNIAAGNIAIKYGAKASCTTIVTACASGTNAIGEAFNMIRTGRADVIISGGTEAAITPIALAGFTGLTALSTTNDPDRASIPFDAERDGFVMGEGAGIVILESLEHAQKRNARIYSEVVGYGSTCDAYHMTAPAPEGEGAARAIREALNDAEIDKSCISYINAHGTGTPFNDKFEVQAIKTVFGEDAYKIPVSSTKSMTGHLLGAAGGIEAIICTKALTDGFIPPTIGYKVADPECDLDCVPNTGREAELQYAMSNSLGFGGHNAVIIIKRF